jgi:hypothetical protein
LGEEYYHYEPKMRLSQKHKRWRFMKGDRR